MHFQAPGKMKKWTFSCFSCLKRSWICVVQSCLEYLMPKIAVFSLSLFFPRVCECFLWTLTTFNRRNLPLCRKQSARHCPKPPQPPGSSILGIFGDLGEYFSPYPHFYLTNPVTKCLDLDPVWVWIFGLWLQVGWAQLVGFSNNALSAPSPVKSREASGYFSVAASEMGNFLEYFKGKMWSGKILCL